MGGSTALLADPPLERTRFEPFAGMIAKIHRRRERQAQAQSGGLIQFVRYFWHVLEPQTPLVEGWALEAVCKHLEAVTLGEIKRLLVNVPPSFMKSLLKNVFWPAWEWSAMEMPHTRYVTFSYAASLGVPPPLS